MLAQEIVHTCTNAHVAEAALASIGGDFMPRFAAEASRRELPPGCLAACVVRAFARSADEEDWTGVKRAARDADQPVLAGLRFILDHSLRYAVAESEAAGASPPSLRTEAAARARARA